MHACDFTFFFGHNIAAQMTVSALYIIMLYYNWSDNKITVLPAAMIYSKVDIKIKVCKTLLKSLMFADIFFENFFCSYFEK